jgi:hypothetical protein
MPDWDFGWTDQNCLSGGQLAFPLVGSISRL